ETRNDLELVAITLCQNAWGHVGGDRDQRDAAEGVAVGVQLDAVQLCDQRGSGAGVAPERELLRGADAPAGNVLAWGSLEAGCARISLVALRTWRAHRACGANRTLRAWLAQEP